MDPALLSYIREARAAGLTDDQIVEELRNAGWDESAVREAVSASAPQSFAGPPELYIPRPDSPVVRFLHNVRRSLGFKVGIAVLGLAVIGAGAYAGWRYYDELPANALADMPKKMAALKSAAYQLQLRLRVNPASEKTASLPRELQNAQAELRVSGAYAVRTGAAADFSALLDFTLELEKQTVAVSAEIRQVEGTFYLRLIKLPTELLGALLPADRSVVPEITRYLNVWYSFKADSLNKYIPGFEIDRSAAGLDPAKQAKIKELVAKANLYHIQSVTRNELIGEVDVYRYLADLLTENLLALVREMAVVLDNRTFTAAEEGQLRTVLAQAAKAKVQLWVGKDDHLLRRSHVSLDDVSAGASLLSTEINLEFTDFNQARIGAPEGALSLEAVIDEAISRQQRLTRDSRRITDLRQIQLALELFADSHRGQYPADIYSVTPCGRAAACGLASVDACGGKLCLAAVPTDPLDRTYAYAPHTTRRTIDAYHLGASLEESTNSELRNDRDCNSLTGGNCPFSSGWNQTAAFEGLDNLGCYRETDRACYDLTP